MKQLFLLILISTPFLCNAQAFFGVEILNKGAGANVGFIANSIHLQVGGIVPLSKTENPTVKYLSLGYEITGNDFYLTPMVGYSSNERKDLSQFQSEGKVATLKQSTQFYRIEIGKERFMGRYYAAVSYAKSLSFGIGIKVLFKRQNNIY